MQSTIAKPKFVKVNCEQTSFEYKRVILNNIMLYKETHKKHIHVCFLSR